MCHSRPGRTRLSRPTSSRAWRLLGFVLTSPCLPRRWMRSWMLASLASLLDLGGLAVQSRGRQTRYEDPDSLLERIATAPDDDVQILESYAPRSAKDLVARRIEEIHAAGSRARGLRDAGRGAAIRLVLRRARRRSVPRPVPGIERSPPRLGVRGARVAEFARFMSISVAVGNTTSFDAAYQLMGQGIGWHLRGVGLGAGRDDRGGPRDCTRSPP